MICFFQIISALILILWLMAGLFYACGSIELLYKCTDKRLNMWLMIFEVTSAFIIVCLIIVMQIN